MRCDNTFPGAFPTTHWSLIKRAGDDKTAVRLPALAELLQRYLPALRAFLVRGRKMDPHRADDLLQEFIADKVLQGSLLDTVDSTKGKFRSLLMRALINRTLDQNRREHAVKRAPQLATQLDRDSWTQQVVLQQEANVFDVAWAREVLAATLARMRAECTERKQESIWAIFAARELDPLVNNRPPEPYERLVQRFAFASPSQASNALITAKRQFRRTLEAVLAEYCGDRSEVEAEIADLRQLLATGGRLETDLQQFLPAADAESGHPLADLCASECGDASDWAPLYNVGDAAGAGWTPSELGEILRHQLSIPLHMALADIERPDSCILSSGDAPHAAPSTLAALFSHPQGFLEQLQAVKRWAKSTAPVQTLPGELKNVLYFAALAAGLVRADMRLTRLDDELLLSGFEWSRRQSWLPESLRELFVQAISDLRNRIGKQP